MRIKLWKRPRPEPKIKVLKGVEPKHDIPQQEYEDYSTDIRPIVLAKRR